MSVRKRQWTTRKGVRKEAWILDYVDQAGKRHIQTFERKRDADRAEAQTKTEVHAGVHTAHSNSKNVAEAAELWLKTCEADGLERTTVDSYRNHVTNHINPFLGRERLSQLTVPRLRTFLDLLRDGDPSMGEKLGAPRSAALIKKVIRSLGSLLSDAQERGLVARNVVREMKVKRHRGRERQAERRQKKKLEVGVHIPSPQEIKAIVHHLHGDRRPLMLSFIFTGFRASEVRGMPWKDVDFARREITVRQRIDEYNEVGAPKSESGQRTIPIPSILVTALKEMKLSSTENSLGLVFAAKNGSDGPAYYGTMRKEFWRAQIDAGVTKPMLDKHGRPVVDADGKPLQQAKYSGLHALRHFYASWCINAKEDGGLGLPPKVVQERLGHSTISMTLDTYGHLFPRNDDSSQMDHAERSLLG